MLLPVARAALRRRWPPQQAWNPRPTHHRSCGRRRRPARCGAWRRGAPWGAGGKGLGTGWRQPQCNSSKSGSPRQRLNGHARAQPPRSCRSLEGGRDVEGLREGEDEEAGHASDGPHNVPALVQDENDGGDHQHENLRAGEGSGDVWAGRRHACNRCPAGALAASPGAQQQKTNLLGAAKTNEVHIAVAASAQHHQIGLVACKQGWGEEVRQRPTRATSSSHRAPEQGRNPYQRSWQRRRRLPA